jgi:hypothetical protein
MQNYPMAPHSTLLNRYWANCGFPDLYILIRYITPTSNIIICGGHYKFSEQLTLYTRI